MVEKFVFNSCNYLLGNPWKKINVDTKVKNTTLHSSEPLPCVKHFPSVMILHFLLPVVLWYLKMNDSDICLSFKENYRKLSWIIHFYFPLPHLKFYVSFDLEKSHDIQERLCKNLEVNSMQEIVAINNTMLS